MKQNLRIIIVASACIIGIGLFTYFYQPTDTPTTTNHGEHAMTVSSDQEFLSMMVPHHQEAVDTAKEVIARGGEVPEVKKLAENIILSQEKEIQQMKDWYLEWYGTVLPETDKYVAMMRPLNSLSGKALDQQFVEDMIGYHEGAVSMAEQLQGFTTRSEMKTFAAQIITAQSAEIKEMKRWLVDIFKQSKIVSQYSGQETRNIKALSQEDIDGLLAGSGTPFGGMAKPGELNGYPGPRHILDAVKAGEISLTREQLKQVESQYAEMKMQAVELGTKIVSLEKELDNSFANETITEQELQEKVSMSAGLYSKLRFVHLKYHLAMRNILTPAQIEQYNSLRGYTAGGNPCDKIPEGHDAAQWKLHNGCK